MIFTDIFHLSIRRIGYRYIGFCLFWWTLAQPAVAQFTTLTSETRVNTTTSGDQFTYWWSLRTMAVQPDGGYIVTWLDAAGSDGSSDGIYFQRFNAAGVKVGAETLVNTTTVGSQYSPSVAVAPDGGFLVAWEGPGSSIDVWGQLYTKDGAKIGTEFLLNTTTSGNQRYPEVQFYPDGTFVAGFVDAAQTVLQRFTASGVRIGLETRISSGTGDVVMDGLCVRPDNSLLVFWTSGGDVYAQLFTSTLTAIGTQRRLNAYTAGTQEYAVGRVDGEGNIFISWEDLQQDGSGIGAYYRRFDSNLNPLSTNELAVTSNTTGNQIEPQITVHPSGRYAISWTDYNNRDGGGGDGSSVWFREFNKDGNPVGVETMVNQTTTNYQDYPVMDMNKAGRLVIVFEGKAASDYDVYARAYQLTTTGTTTMSVTPTNVTASDTVTVTMTLTNPTTLANIIPNSLSVSGTNDVFAELISGPAPSSATVGTSGTTFTWIYRITANGNSGVLTFGGSAYDTLGNIFPYAVTSSISVKPSIYLSDITAPNLVNDSNSPSSAPSVFTIGAKIVNPSLNTLTDVTVYIGNGTTAGTFPTTTMYLSQTNNTYQGTFSLTPLGGTADCTRPLITLGAAKQLIAGAIDFNGDGVINTSDDGTLSNDKIVIDGLIDYNLSGSVTTADDYTRPSGFFSGYREPNILNGYVDSNNDGLINSSDNGTYGGEVRNIYWQVSYATTDASSQPTFGSCGNFGDDLRYNWAIWTTSKDAGITRYDEIEDYAKVRCELSASSNKLKPTSTGYTSSSPPSVIGGKVDVNGDGSISSTDDGTYYGKTVINGQVDMNGSGTITIADDGILNNFTVIDGSIDVNGSGFITAADDGVLVQIGQTFTITINNADFGTIGAGFDENLDNLGDYDIWYQPVGNSNWAASAFRLIDIQSDIIGKGGNNPLNGITTHFDNEPYLSRLFDDRLGQSGGFEGDYTYTFLVIGAGNSSIKPYQQAASGNSNVSYNGDFGQVVNVITGTGGLTLTQTASPTNVTYCGTVSWNMTYQNTATTAAGDPSSGNGVVIETPMPTYTRFVANSATCGTYPCVPSYSTDNGSTWSSTQPTATSVTNLRFYIEAAIPANGTGTVSFQNTFINCPTNGTIIRDTAAIKIGTGTNIDTAAAFVTVVQVAPVIATCPPTLTIVGCGTNDLTTPAYSVISAVSSETEFENTTNLGAASDDCGILNVKYSDVVTGTCALSVVRTWVVTDACNNSATCNQAITVAPSNAVGNLVFQDVNQNNIYDAGDAVINGVTLTLYKVTTSGDVQINQTTSDATGFYTFTSLDPTAMHYIRVTLPVGYTAAAKANKQNSDQTDSDIDPLTYETFKFRLRLSEINYTVDIGLR